MVDELMPEGDGSRNKSESDLQALWDGVSAEKEREAIGGKLKQKPTHPAIKVKRQLGFKILYFVLGIAFISGMRLTSVNETSILLFDITNVSFVLCTIYLIAVWRSLPSRVEVADNLREAVLRSYKNTKRALRIEEGLGLCLYPLAAAAGMLWGYEYRSADFAADPHINWLTLLIVVAIVTPLAHFAAVWRNKVAFGKYLKHLKSLIDQFDEVAH